MVAAADDNAWMVTFRAAVRAGLEAKGPAAIAAMREELARLEADGAESNAAAAPIASTTQDATVAAGPTIVKGEFFGESPAMLRVKERITKYARSDAPVLIVGESGTGKDLAARAIHAESPRARRSMIAENCAAIPETLLESTLFGHVRGAFTGAVKDHPGHFVSADKGTLFLDEIGDMSLSMQVKLLRALQEGEVRPVGGSKVRKVDVRVLGATNRDLQAMIAKKTFREDLYYRLDVLRLELPALRDREDDVVALATRFLNAAAARGGRTLGLSASAAVRIAAAGWPGNVRQLQNEMQRLAALTEGDTVDAADLSREIG